VGSESGRRETLDPTFRTGYWHIHGTLGLRSLYSEFACQVRSFQSMSWGHLLHKSISLTPIKSHKRAAEKRYLSIHLLSLSAFNHKMLPAKANSVKSIVLIKVTDKAGTEKKSLLTRTINHVKNCLNSLVSRRHGQIKFNSQSCGSCCPDQLLLG
jgi:hypothetical protein